LEVLDHGHVITPFTTIAQALGPNHGENVAGWPNPTSNLAFRDGLWRAR
jgi:hypothetical protein